eukprot:75160_1
MPKISAKSKLLKKKKNNKKKKKTVVKHKVKEERKTEEIEIVEEDHEIEAQDLSHLLEPMQAHDLKHGWWCIDDKSGYPGQVSQLKVSKTGKHGHTKFTYKLSMPHTAKVSNPMHPGNDQLMKPIMKKDEYRFVQFVDEEQKVVECRDHKLIKCNIAITAQPKAYEKVMNLVRKRKKDEMLMMTVLSGPKYSRKKIEIVRCIIGGKLISES